MRTALLSGFRREIAGDDRLGRSVALHQFDRQQRRPLGTGVVAVRPLRQVEARASGPARAASRAPWRPVRQWRLLPRILVETRLYHRLGVDWIRRKKPALSIVYLEGTDTIGHVFAAFAPPRQEGIDRADFDRYQCALPTLLPGDRRPARRIPGPGGGDRRRPAHRVGPRLPLGRGTPARQRPRGRDGRSLASRRGDLRAVGQGIEPSATRGEGRVGQVAATILGLLGLPRAAGTEGPALAGVAEVLPAKNYGVRSPRQVAAGGAPADEAIDRLKALGYVGSGESATRPESAGAGTRTGGSFVNEGTLLREAGRPPRRAAHSSRRCASTRTCSRRSTTSPRSSRRRAAPGKPTSCCSARSATASTRTWCRRSPLRRGKGATCRGRCD